MNLSGDSGMTSSVDLNDSMSQEGSGTSWLPASTPVYAKMSMNQGNMFMIHGAIMPRFTDVGIGSRRGDNRVDAPNWLMAMYSHPLNSSSQIGFHGMFSLDPLTEGGYGYPLLYQTGETWHAIPLHDRQHPHNFQAELSTTYSRMVGGGKSVYLYIADPGEPALGPPAYMHRLLASDYADAPIGHHWQDATHITFGVATAGLNLGSKVKIEASDFTGREPGEDRFEFYPMRFDSYSTRLSYNPDRSNAFQVSYGLVHNPEGDGANVHRTTASWIYNQPMGNDANFTSALVWGQNDATTEGKTNSYLFEADYQRGRDTFFTRVENIQKSGIELLLPEAALAFKKFDLGAYTVGCVRDVKHGGGVDTGVGLAVTADTHPGALDTDYGHGTPLSFEVYLRFRASRMKSKMADMSDIETSSTPNTDAVPILNPTAAPSSTPLTVNTPTTQQAPPASTAVPPVVPLTPVPGNLAAATPAPTIQHPADPGPKPVTVASVTAVIDPSSPKARASNYLTISAIDSDGNPITEAVIKGKLEMLSMDMGSTQLAFIDAGQGHYRSKVSFAMAGPWAVTVLISVPGQSKSFTKKLTFQVAR
jgi:hypothetical protein